LRRVRGFDAVSKGSGALASVPRNARSNFAAFLRSRPSGVSSKELPWPAARSTLPAQPPPSDRTRTRGERARI